MSVVGAPMSSHPGHKSMDSDKSFCAKHGKKLVVLLLIVGLIGYVVADLVTQSCTAVETFADTDRRFKCELDANYTTGACGEDYTFDPTANDNEGGCTTSSACVSVGIEAFLDWIEENPAAGAFVTAVVYCIATVAFIPGSLLTIGSGAAFSGALGLGIGALVGAIAVLVGATVGALIAFILGRYLLREVVAGWASKYKVLGAIDAALNEQGLKIVLLLRFSPVIPFNAFNYLMGSTGCTFRDYALGTTFGIIPGTVGYVFIGALVGQAASGSAGGECEASAEEKAIQTTILVVGIIATIIAVACVSYYSKKQLKKYIADEEQVEDGEVDDDDDVKKSNV